MRHAAVSLTDVSPNQETPTLPKWTTMILASFGAAFKFREISSGVCWLDLKESLNWGIAETSYLHYNNAKVKAAKPVLAKVFGFTISSLVVHDYFLEEHNQIS